MIYALLHPETPALVLLEPSMPREIAGRQPASVQRDTPLEGFGPEFLGVYLDDPIKTRAVMPELTDAELADFLQHSAGAEESGIAMRQRQAGISVPATEIKCPVLVLYGGLEGREMVAAENVRLVEYLGGRSHDIEGAGHWGLVYHEPAVADAAMKVDSWLRRVTSNK